MELQRCPKCRYFLKPEEADSFRCPYQYKRCPVEDERAVWKDVVPAQQ